MTHVEVLKEMAQTATQKLSWVRSNGASLEVPAYKKMADEASALTAAIAALEAVGKADAGRIEVNAGEAFVWRERPIEDAEHGKRVLIIPADAVKEPTNDN